MPLAESGPGSGKKHKSQPHAEKHQSSRSGWLRAAVLGSDDAIVSTASLMIGVLASSATREAALVAGVAGLVAGAMSMAVGEYVSVSSQSDAQRADIAREGRMESMETAAADIKEWLQGEPISVEQMAR